MAPHPKLKGSPHSVSCALSIVVSRMGSKRKDDAERSESKSKSKKVRIDVDSAWMMAIY